MTAPPVAGGERCLFWEIVEARAPAHGVFEDTRTVALPAVSRCRRGPALVIPELHGERLIVFGTEVRAAVFAAPSRRGRRRVRRTSAHPIAPNAGSRTGRTAFHLRFHLVPRGGEPDPFPPPGSARIPDEGAGQVVA